MFYLHKIYKEELRSNSMKIGKYNYPDEVMETVKIKKTVRNDFSKFCKQRKINKSKLIEEFYKTVLLRFREGSMNTTNGYVTLKVC